MPAKFTSVPIVCEQCRSTFWRQPSELNKKPGSGRFCSRACKAEGMRGVRIPLLDRFRAKVQRTTDALSCWPWTGMREKRTGYGKLICEPPSKSYVAAHRVAWAEVTGDMLTSDDVIGHICDNPPCTRNDSIGVYEVEGVLLPRRGHLFKGTHVSNQADKISKGREARGQRHGSHTMPERRPRGAAHPNASLAEADVRLIRSLYAEGDIRQIDLAERFGVNQAQISAIVRCKSWHHLT